jgi:GNAT superfamily N-acetyltransferase
MLIDACVECPVHDSFRVRQVAGLFDLPLDARCRARFSVELPDPSGDWRIGTIVGPSGSGKSTVARAAYGDGLYRGHAWPADKAVIDCLGDRPIKQITQMLTSVGFSSPPSWVKPYQVLSNGEKFRCDLARALLCAGPLVVFDEFTSAVDRTVAQIGSAAVARAIRRSRAGCHPERSEGSRAAAKILRSAQNDNRCVQNDDRSAQNDDRCVQDDILLRFVAVTCHYDVLPWLEPDWVLDMATGTLDWRRLRRPPIALEIFRCRRAVWRLFAPHHYLSGALNRAVRCYVATWRDEPVAFCALLSAVGRGDVWRISRIVVLPDYQGIGIGGRFIEAIGELFREQGLRTTITTGHPAMIGYLRSSPAWHVREVSKGGNAWGGLARRKNIRSTSRGRTVVSAEYCEPGGTP